MDLTLQSSHLPSEKILHVITRRDYKTQVLPTQR